MSRGPRRTPALIALRNINCLPFRVGRPEVTQSPEAIWSGEALPLEGLAS